MTEELKPCPFCGGKAEHDETCDQEHFIFCIDCGAGTVPFDTQMEAVAAWNTRPIEDALQRELNEAIDDNYKNVWKVQKQAERGAKYAQKENARLREALAEIEKTVEDAQDTIYSFHFDLDSKHGAFILETVKNALKGGKE